MERLSEILKMNNQNIILLSQKYKLNFKRTVVLMKQVISFPMENIKSTAVCTKKAWAMCMRRN